MSLLPGSSFIGLQPRRGGSGVAPLPDPAVAPTLTRTSADGTNPMSWSSTYTDVFPEQDYIAARWRVNGGAWTNETDRLLAWDDYFDAIDGVLSFVWPLFDAFAFPAGSLVEVQEGIKRGSDPVVWSNTISDTMTASVTYEEVNVYSSASSSTAVNFTGVRTGEGRALAILTAFSNAGGTTESWPASLTLNLAGGGTVNMSRVGSAGGRALSRRFAFYLADTVHAASTSHFITATRPAAARSNVMVVMTLKDANPVPTAGPTFTAPATESNPHATTSLTCPANGIIIGAWMKEATNTVTATDGDTSLIANSTAFAECGLAVGVRTTTGAPSIDTSTNPLTWGRAAVAFQP